MRVLGIDPGLEGAVCFFDSSYSLGGGRRWVTRDLPTAGEKAQRRINVAALRDFINEWRPQHAFIELAQAMPRQGVSSSFRYGRGVGAIEATVACCGVPVTYVTPQTWKKHFGLKGPDKEKSRARALQLAPELGTALARKKDHGRAEAALIALYGCAFNNF
jgi:crossover junction endodeoxyribonuclease RuvC